MPRRALTSVIHDTGISRMEHKHNTDLSVPSLSLNLSQQPKIASRDAGARPAPLR